MPTGKKIEKAKEIKTYSISISYDNYCEQWFVALVNNTTYLIKNGIILLPFLGIRKDGYKN
jgi:hypothetical protein